MKEILDNFKNPEDEIGNKPDDLSNEDDERYNPVYVSSEEEAALMRGSLPKGVPIKIEPKNTSEVNPQLTNEIPETSLGKLSLTNEIPEEKPLVNPPL
ncbi:hypothetical protein KY385_03805 [Candidatus Parcubacteria bacterium]|nr:hypothetical protein [Candidatus Parcubacteria bacterium]